ncbi:MAG: ATP-binding protein [candidate division Zixibacteria bacterium]|nr:ATP-binding protein [candidate division Zixibacteria bacterium]
MRRRPLLWQLFPSYILVIILSITAVTWFIIYSSKQFFLTQNAKELEARAVILRERMTGLNFGSDTAFINDLCKRVGLESATRITVILPTGKVIGDTDEDPTKMENHANRPEVQEAVGGRIGVATRYSHTLYETMMYVAVPIIKDGQILGIVRTALPLTSIEHAFGSIYTKIIVGGFLIAILAMAVSFYISRRITLPLVKMKRAAGHFTRGDFTHHLPIGTTEEIGQLAETMNEMAKQLNEKIRTIINQRNEREAILDSMVEGVIAFDMTERVIGLNRAAAQMLGVEINQVTGRYLQESFRNANLQKFVARILEGGATQDEEIGIQDKANIILHLYGSPIHSENGQNLGAVIVLHDVTRLHQLETIRREFVANVSHELRTPITSIKGFIDTLRDGGIHSPEDTSRFLEIIARQTDRLNSIIENLLTLSELDQTERGNIGLELTELKGVLQNAIGACELKAAAKEIQIQIQCDDDLKANINAPLLEQAVINLIDNAIKYSETKSSIEISAKLDNATIAINVTDHGCGIEKLHLPRLFERFYRVDRARSRELGGTGLGLSIVKHIVSVHDGRVEVESTPGKGSTFSIFLPLSTLPFGS